MVAEQTMDVVEMVLGGRVNKGLVTLIQQSGGRAVGLCGKDNNIIKARQMVEKDIGFVGEVTKVDSSLLETLVRDGFTPVVASVAADENGQALNVNADIAAGEVIAWVPEQSKQHSPPFLCHLLDDTPCLLLHLCSQRSCQG